MPPSESDRILELLEALIVLRKIRLRDLEQDLGMSAGTLRRILNGKIELKLRHITDILAVLDIPARTFFKIAYETDDLGQAQSQLARAHRIAHLEPQPVTLSPEELEAVIVATIGRLGLSVRPPDPQGAGPRPSKEKKSPPRKKPKPRRKKA
jgi:transcriptional regulator with XRE-family HTH domain